MGHNVWTHHQKEDKKARSMIDCAEFGVMACFKEGLGGGDVSVDYGQTQR